MAVAERDPRYSSPGRWGPSARRSVVCSSGRLARRVSRSTRRATCCMRRRSGSRSVMAGRANGAACCIARRRGSGVPQWNAPRALGPVTCGTHRRQRRARRLDGRAGALGRSCPAEGRRVGGGHARRRPRLGARRPAGAGQCGREGGALTLSGRVAPVAGRPREGARGGPGRDDGGDPADRQRARHRRELRRGPAVRPQRALRPDDGRCARGGPTRRGRRSRAGRSRPG